jgi:hypothetical protein
MKALGVLIELVKKTLVPGNILQKIILTLNFCKVKKYFFVVNHTVYVEK